MTDQITPQEAQQLLDGATPESKSGLTIPGPGDHALSLAAPRLAKTIAAMDVQYTYNVTYTNGTKSERPFDYEAPLNKQMVMDEASSLLAQDHVAEVEIVSIAVTEETLVASYFFDQEGNES